VSKQRYAVAVLWRHHKLSKMYNDDNLSLFLVEEGDPSSAETEGCIQADKLADSKSGKNNGAVIISCTAMVIP
jgi:hypothetical protein